MQDFLIFAVTYAGLLLLGVALVWYSAREDSRMNGRPSWQGTAALLAGAIVCLGGPFVAFVLAHY